MPLLHYVAFENVKGFEGVHRIELDHPTVIVGPNNSGKTTILQVLALWSVGVKAWHERRAESKAERRTGTSLNRLALSALPLPNYRALWNGARIRNGNARRPLWIEAGLDVGGTAVPIRCVFTYQSADVAYVDVVRTAGGPPDAALVLAARLPVELLHPLSGLSSDETVLQRGRVDFLLGRGETAQVLRNLCLEVSERSKVAWGRVGERIERLFGVQLGTPRVTTTAAIEVTYTQAGVAEPLELLSAGRGFLQVLLVLVCLEARPGAVLLVDEPDAHLEILRQRQIYLQLRDFAADAGSQVVLASHAEQILEAALDRSLTFVVGGRIEALSRSKQDVLNSLKHFGTQTYVRARDRGHILYLEGSSDLALLEAFARRLGHRAADVWDPRANVYFVQDNWPEPSSDAELDRVEGGFGIPAPKHWKAIRPLVEGLRGLAILDGDGRGRADFEADGLKVRYWRRYEAESYLVTPELLVRAAALTARAESPQRPGGGEPRGRQQTLFEAEPLEETVLRDVVLARVFPAGSDLAAYLAAAPDARRVMFRGAASQRKASELAELFFAELARRDPERGAPLRKGELHTLVALLRPEEIDAEVVEKLDLLASLFGA